MKYTYIEKPENDRFTFEVFKDDITIDKFISRKNEGRFVFLSRIDHLVKEMTNNTFGSLMKGIFYNEDPRYATSGVHDDFHYYDKGSYFDSRNEIYTNKVYHFYPENKNPVIIDAGANIGISSRYFLENFPDCNLTSIEADPFIFELLTKNLLKFKNVNLLNRCLSNKSGFVDFYSDKGMGGRTQPFQHQKPISVETILLSNLLEKFDHVDFLKIDIEGEETLVIEECKNQLYKVDFMFIEYHNFIGKNQTLDTILSILKECGHEYKITSEHPNINPFINQQNLCDGIDFTVNIFSKLKK